MAVADCHLEQHGIVIRLNEEGNVVLETEEDEIEKPEEMKETKILEGEEVNLQNKEDQLEEETKNLEDEEFKIQKAKKDNQEEEVSQSNWEDKTTVESLSEHDCSSVGVDSWASSEQYPVTGILIKQETSCFRRSEPGGIESVKSPFIPCVCGTAIKKEYGPSDGSCAATLSQDDADIKELFFTEGELKRIDMNMARLTSQGELKGTDMSVTRLADTSDFTDKDADRLNSIVVKEEIIVKIENEERICESVNKADTTDIKKVKAEDPGEEIHLNDLIKDNISNTGTKSIICDSVRFDGAASLDCTCEGNCFVSFHLLHTHHSKKLGVSDQCDCAIQGKKYSDSFQFQSEQSNQSDTVHSSMECGKCFIGLKSHVQSVVPPSRQQIEAATKEAGTMQCECDGDRITCKQRSSATGKEGAQKKSRQAGKERAVKRTRQAGKEGAVKRPRQAGKEGAQKKLRQAGKEGTVMKARQTDRKGAKERLSQTGKEGAKEKSSQAGKEGAQKKISLAGKEGTQKKPRLVDKKGAKEKPRQAGKKGHLKEPSHMFSDTSQSGRNKKDENTVDGYVKPKVIAIHSPKVLLCTREMPRKKKIQTQNTRDTVHCSHCSKEFETLESVISHLKKRKWTKRKPKKKLYACSLCAVEVEGIALLIEHMETHCDVVCKECGMKLTDREKLQEHIQRVESKFYQCTSCDTSCLNSCQFSKHQRRHTKKSRTYKCSVCGRVLKEKSSLVKHMQIIHSGTLVKSHQCLLCPRKFTQKTNLAKHVRHVHHKYSEDTPKYTCPLCSKDFVSMTGLGRHTRVHTKEKPYVCDKCQAGFSEKHHLNRHLLTHTGEKPYVCKTCGQCFRYQHDMRQHVQGHHGELPHRCRICSLGFRLKHQLDTHSAVHTGIKYYVCKICGLRQATYQARYLHMRNCHGKKLFNCQVCAKKFSLQTNLRKHLLTHASD